MPDMHVKAILQIKDIRKEHASDLDDYPRPVGRLPQNLRHHGSIFDKMIRGMHSPER